MKVKEIMTKFKSWPLCAQMITIIIPIFTILVIISIYLFGPSFSFVDHHMSTLGTQSANPNGYLFFDIACIITGILLYPFFYGLKHWATEDKVLNYILYLIIGIGFIASFGIIMQAIFRGDFGYLHFIFSAVHWVADFVFLAIAPIPLLRHRKFYRRNIIVCIIATVFNFIYVISIGAYPWIEWITAVLSLVFAVLIGVNMVKEEIPPSF